MCTMNEKTGQPHTQLFLHTLRISTNVSYVHPAAVTNEDGSVLQYQGESNTDSFQGTLAGYLLYITCM
jgi:hypothetical protein